jgi:hypothetical protein
MGCCLGTFQVDPLSSRHDIDNDDDTIIKKQHPSKSHTTEPEKPHHHPEETLVIPKEVPKKEKSKSSSSSDSGSEKGHKVQPQPEPEPYQPQPEPEPEPYQPQPEPEPQPEPIPVEPEITYQPEPEPEPEPEQTYQPKYHTVEQPEISEVALAGVSVSYEGSKDDFAFEFPSGPTPVAEIDDNFSLEIQASRPPTVPVYRYHNGSSHDHFYTQNAAEIGATESGQSGHHGYTCEGVGFYLAENETVGYTAVYRFWNPSSKDHFYTSSEEEKDSVHAHGYSLEGVVGYISTTQIEGTIPVYRYWNPNTHDHFYTSNALEIGATEPGVTGAHGYTCEGVLGYAFHEAQ